MSTGDGPMEVLLADRLAQLAHQLRLRSEAALSDAKEVPSGVGPAQFFLLSQLAEGGAQPQRALATALGKSAANISQLLGKLEAAGLVERGVRSANRLVELTDAGREVVARLRPRHAAAVAEALAPLSAAERQLMLLWVERLLSGTG